MSRTPEFPIPLAATLAAVAAATGLSVAATSVVTAASPVEQPWPIVAGLAYVLTAFAFAGLLHAIGTRRVIGHSRLQLEADAVRPDEATPFTISDPRGRLASASTLRLSLAWRERSTRTGGRKVYTEGPYELTSTVDWAYRDPLPAGDGGPGIAGELRVVGSEIAIEQLEGWTQQVEILVRLRAGAWRTCFFALPFERERQPRRSATS